MTLIAIRNALPFRRLSVAPAPGTLTGLRPHTWRDIAKQSALIWLATRVALLLFTYCAVVFSGVYTSGQPLPSVMLHAWDQWDTLWYVRIAGQGYTTDQAAAFFPLYPMLIHAFGFVVGSGHLLFSAMLVSNLAAFAAFIGVGLLAAHEFGDSSAVLAILVLAAYPLAFFLFAGYTESLFLTFAVFAVYFARCGRWRWAAACTFFAALTRSTGIILLAPLLWEYGRQHDWQHGGWRLQVSALLARTRAGLGEATDLVSMLVAAPVAFLAYAGYLGVRFGHPLLFLNVEEIYWHHENIPFWQTLPSALHQLFATPGWSYWQSRQLVDVAPVVLFGVLTLITFRRTPIAFIIYMVELLYLTASTPIGGPDPLASAGRYLAVAFPIFLILGHWASTRPWLVQLLLGGGFMLQAVLAFFFLQGHWLV